VQQRFAEQMQRQVVRKITNLPQNVVKFCRADKSFGPFARVAEAAREIAAIGDLDKDAFKLFQAGMFSTGGHRSGDGVALI
jgi:hypothetical protein